MARSGIVVAVLACCGKQEAPPATQAPAPAPAPGPAAAATPAAALPTCIEPKARLGWAAVRDKTIDTCWDPPGCWAFDVAQQRWAPEPTRDQPTSGPTAPYAKVTSATEVSLCTAAGACKPVALVPPGAPDYSAGDGGAAVSADGSLLAVVVGGKSARVFDAKGAKLRDIPSWPTAQSNGKAPATLQSLAFVGDSLALYVSATPISDDVRLFVPRTGKLLGQVTTAGNGFLEAAPFDLGNHQYGWLELGTRLVHVVDATTGKGVRDVRFGSDGGDDDNAPALAWVDQLPDKTLVALDHTTLVTIAAATGAMARFPAPACPAAP